MASNSEKNRISIMVDALGKALAGDDSVVMEISPKNDALDTLAAAINDLLKKTGKPLPSPVKEETQDDTSGLNNDRYQNILNRMQESYFETDIEGNIIFFNDRVTRKLGYTAQEIRGMNFRMFLNEENRKKVHKTGLKIFFTGEDVQDFEWQLIQKNGQAMDVESSIALLRDKKGEPAGFHGVVITARKQTERDRV